MRTLILLTLASLWLSACNKKADFPDAAGNAEQVSDRVGSQLPLTTIGFPKEAHNFGKVKEGQKVLHTFKFTNTGKEPLLITAVKPSCGCTTPSYSKNTIQPGEEGFVEVQFDSKGRVGANHKSVEVFANTEPKVHVLVFDVEVEK
jgi:Protein of unknown function (DUF1573)